MPYATHLLLLLTSVSSIDQELASRLRRMWERQERQLLNVALEFLLAPVSPHSAREFERKLAEAVRELARQVVEDCYNLLEAEDPEAMPHDVRHAAGGDRRLNRKMRHASPETTRRYYYMARAEDLAGKLWQGDPLGDPGPNSPVDESSNCDAK